MEVGTMGFFMVSNQLPWLRGNRQLTENKNLSLSVQSPAKPAILQPGIGKKTNKAPSVRVIVICSDYRLLRQDSNKGVDPASTLDEDESTLHSINFMAWS